MPCNSDYMAASGQELESKRVCGLLSYALKALGRGVTPWVDKAADDYYGNVARLDEATKLLCGLLRSLTKEEEESIIYNAHDENSRNLASWWERHQEWDERRVKEEEEGRKQVVFRERALRKLSVEEMKALGLVD